MSTIAVILTASFAWLLWRILRRFTRHSSLQTIPGPPSPSFLQGNLGEMFDRHAWKFLDDMGTKYGGVVRFHDMLGSEGIYIFDPLALNHVVIKDQDDYPDVNYVRAYRQIFLGPGVLSSQGEHHRRQRKLLNPVFNMNNIRDMTPIFYEVVHRLRDGIERQARSSNGEVDLLKWMGRAALELMGQGGLGCSFDPLTEDVNNEYGDAIKEFMPALARCGPWAVLAPLAEYIPSARFKRFLIDCMPFRAVQEVKTIVDTLDRMSKELYADKVRALKAGDDHVRHQVGEGKDIMSVLLRENMQAVEEDRMPEEEVIAQITTLIAAGTDTTSNALSRILHILSDRPDVQDKMRAEIAEAQQGQDSIPYDQLVELPYMEAVCKETLRLYPPAVTMLREAGRDTVLPVSEPIHCTDGSIFREVAVPRGTAIVVGIQSCNRNKALWGEDAEEWKPERWLGPLPTEVTNAKVPGVYSNLMTFLGGSRACIGFKFSQLEMKVVLAVLLGRFRFGPSGREIVWNHAVVAYPTVGPTAETPSLPLRVELLS